MTKQNKEKNPREGTRNRDSLLCALCNPIKTLKQKPSYIHRRPGADSCRPCGFCVSPCEFVHLRFDHVDLEGLVFLVSPIPFGSCTPLTSSSSVFPEPRREGFDGDILQEAASLLMAGQGTDL